METNTIWQKRRLLSPEDFSPSHPDLRVAGVFNPGAARLEDRIILLVRVAEQAAEDRDGWIGLPRWKDDRPVIDWVPESDVERIDRRVVRLRRTGLIRLTFLSHLRVVVWDRHLRSWSFGPAWMPEGALECYGVEDPRITQIGSEYWISFVAVSPHGVTTALASTHDFRTFTRHGIVFPPENKDVVLFPEPVAGRYLALHRPVGATRLTRPEIWFAESGDLLTWGNHRPVEIPVADWNADRIGGGCPPRRHPQGWLTIIHGAENPRTPGEVGRYRAAWMLLDRDDPARVLAVEPIPDLTPREPFETSGFVPHVVFPTGWVEGDRCWHVFYGAADCSTAVASFPLESGMPYFDLCSTHRPR